MGFCLNHQTSCEHSLIIDSDGSSTIGSQYTLFSESHSSWDYSAIASPTPDRPSGDIKGLVFKCYQEGSTKSELLTPCNCQRTDYYKKLTQNPYNYDVPGAYIKSDNKISILSDKYIMLYQTENNTADLNITHNDCDKPGGYAVSTNGCDLYVDVNGQTILLESISIGQQYFVISDSHIVTALGAIYYMYAYSLFESYYGIHYTVYGYFKNDINQHVQSEKYIPAGLKKTPYLSSQYSYITPHHDVAGSSKLDTPLYGVGKCAGYLMEIIKKEEGI
jgi:hypothetical protein